MIVGKDTTRTLDDLKVNVKLKLAALWATVMFLYVYVDIISFFKPGVIQDILAGRVWKFEITQAWALGGFILLMIPSLMVFLSLALPARMNRWTSIIVAAVYVTVSIGNSIGETWAFIILGSVVEVVLLSLIIWYAWRWPAVAVDEAARP